VFVVGPRTQIRHSKNGKGHCGGFAWHLESDQLVREVNKTRECTGDVELCLLEFSYKMEISEPNYQDERRDGMGPCRILILVTIKALKPSMENMRGMKSRTSIISTAAFLIIPSARSSVNVASGKTA
jgi:hypothetical protein